jgi:hypothetical protein
MHSNKNHSKKNRGQDSIAEEFSAYISAALVAGANNLALNPAVTSRLAAIGDTYEFYRLKALKFRLHPNGTQTSVAGAAWQAGVIDTAPATVAQLAEGVNNTLLGSRATVPSAWCQVPRKDLAGAFPWYKSVQGTPDVSEEIVGYIFLTGTTTEAYNLEVRGVMEFKQAIAPANTPMEIELRSRLRMERQQAQAAKEREALMKVLTPLPSVRPGFYPAATGIQAKP